MGAQVLHPNHNHHFSISQTLVCVTMHMAVFLSILTIDRQYETNSLSLSSPRLAPTTRGVWTRNEWTVQGYYSPPPLAQR